MMKYAVPGKLASVLTTVLFCSTAFANRPVPRPALLERLNSDVDIIGIVHWGPNTYTEKQWGYGDENPAHLDPSDFSAEQIVGACARGGLRGLVVVAKHHDGFCLWPTKTTEHNITKSPFRGGKGDYVREMEQACRRFGLEFGVYVSPWDRNSRFYATEKYVEIFHAQIKELLSGEYGEIFEMWFDGANGGSGWYGGAKESRKIGVGYYRFDEVFRFVRALQPSICIFNEHDEADFRYGGNERGFVDPDSRATGLHYDNVWANYKKWANKGVFEGTTFHPVEADFPLRKSWFYDRKHSGLTKSSAYLTKLYLGSVGNGATMNIGIAPDKRGRLDDEDVRALAGFKRLKDLIFKKEMRDGEEFNVVVMSEDISCGEQVDAWEVVADGTVILSGKSIGRRRIRVLEKPVKAAECSLRITKDAGKLRKTEMRRYFADPELLRVVMASTTSTGETETARWMADFADQSGVSK